MLDTATIERLAARLDEAERTKTLITMFTKDYPDFSIEDAYAVQRAWTKLQLGRGRIIKGHKIGLTSKAMQNAVGISEPDYGVLFADMFYADATPIPFDRFHAPRIEVELAFVLKAPLRGPDCTIFDVLNATDYVTPALEILETRMHRVDPQTGKARKVMDTISDNAANAALVLGGRPFRPMDADMRWIGALLFRNGEVEETGLAAGVLNHPANGIAWLANRLAPHDEHLAAGEVVLAGSFTRPVDIRRGDTFHADYGAFGSVSGQFVCIKTRKGAHHARSHAAQEHPYRRLQACQPDSERLPHRQSRDVGRHSRPRCDWCDAREPGGAMCQHVRAYEGDGRGCRRHHRRHHQDDGVAEGPYAARPGQCRVAEDVSGR